MTSTVGFSPMISRGGEEDDSLQNLSLVTKGGQVTRATRVIMHPPSLCLDWIRDALLAVSLPPGKDHRSREGCEC